MPTPQEEVAELIHEQKSGFAIFSMGIVLSSPEQFATYQALNPSVAGLPVSQIILNSKINPSENFLWGQSVPGTGYSFSIKDSLDYVESHPKTRINFINTLVIGIILTIGDAFSRNNYFNKRDPELEFLRHLRNGIAHGNRFNITTGVDPITGNLRHPAVFHSLEIIPALNGQPVFGNFIQAGDVFILLDYIVGKLEAGDYNDPI